MLKNPYTISPAELEQGDVMAVTVTLHVNHYGPPYFTMYRCQYPSPPMSIGEGDVPQGDKIFTNCREVAEALFPVALWAGMEPSS